MKYQVAVREVYKTIVDIDEANSEDEAQDMAEAILTSYYKGRGAIVQLGEYEYTLDKEDWGVWEA